MKTLILTIFIALASYGKSAELFVKVNKAGHFKAILGSQIIQNELNIYRFFDVIPGNYVLQIIDLTTNQLYSKANFFFDNNQRIITEVNNNAELKLIGIVAIDQTNWYSYSTTNITSANYTYSPTYSSNQNSVVTNCSSNTGVNTFSNQNNAIINLPVLSAQQFQQFYKSIQKESFDSKKLERTKKLLAKYRLEGSQVAALAKLFAFDSNRLEWTKYAYSKVIDPFSYYEFDQVFEFQTTFKQLIDFIESL